MELCETSYCLHRPIAVCLHCKQYLCVDHLLQHNEQLICQANAHCDEFNRINELIENMSFSEQFASAEEDLNDWLNDQLKQLDKVYEEKLNELKQAQSEVEQKLKAFKDNQRLKLANAKSRLFTPELNKQINIEQLNQMKTTIEELREDIDQFKTNECSITLVNNNLMNYSYKPNIEIQINEKISNKNENLLKVDNSSKRAYDQLKQSQLRADAKPFEYIPEKKQVDSYSSIGHNDFSDRLFDQCTIVRPHM